MEKHTNREYNLWMAYLESQWNRPNRTDNYLMQIAQEIRRVLSKNPGAIKADGFKLKFEVTEAEEPIPPQEKADRSRSVWLGSVGVKHDGE